MRLMVMLLCVVCLMTSCSSRQADMITDDFSCEVSCVYDGTAYEGTLQRISSQKTVLTLTKPASVCGLIMTQSPNGVVLEWGGSSYAASAEDVPDGVLVSVLANVLDAARGREGVVQGSGAAGAYTLRFDEQSGVPHTLEMSDIPLAVRFSNVTKNHKNA